MFSVDRNGGSGDLSRPSSMEVRRSEEAGSLLDLSDGDKRPEKECVSRLLAKRVQGRYHQQPI